MQKQMEHIIEEVQKELTTRAVSNFGRLWELIGELIEKHLQCEHVFYFVKEDLLEEVNLVYGNRKVKSLVEDQYFYQYRAFVFQNL